MTRRRQQPELAAALRAHARAADALRRARDAWSEDQTDDRWSDVESAEAAVTRAEGRLEALEAAQALLPTRAA